MITRWIRLTDEGIEILMKDLRRAQESQCSNEWEWFTNVLDYREMCHRNSHWQTWKMKLKRVLLFLVEKLS